MPKSKAVLKHSDISKSLHWIRALLSEGKLLQHPRRLRAEPLVVVLSVFLAACSLSSLGSTNREDRFREDLRSFHWAVILQDAPEALRFVRAEERDAWNETFACLFEEFRLLDYRVEFVDFEEESSEAAVRVRWTGHPQHSLVVQEIFWDEEWSFHPDKERWSLVSKPAGLGGGSEKCSKGGAGGS